jgi:hypothetical protein
MDKNMEEYTTPKWLQESLNPKPMVVEEIVPDWDTFLASLGKTKEKKKAKVVSRITMDESNNIILHIATPII